MFEQKCCDRNVLYGLKLVSEMTICYNIMAQLGQLQMIE